MGWDGMGWSGLDWIGLDWMELRGWMGYRGVSETGLIAIDYTFRK